MSLLWNWLACPHCYRRINGKRLWYQCTGRGSPGKKGCAVGKDEARERLTNFGDPVRPSFGPKGWWPVSPAQAECDQCGARTGIRVCPECHTPFSTNFGASASPLIAMVGATGTGKTVFLTVLAHELTTNLRRRFDADVRLTSKMPTGDVDAMFRDRKLFLGTTQARAGIREPMVFEWRRPHQVAGLLRQFRTTYLSFYDTAGEDLSQAELARDLVYLGAAKALVLLLDPFMIPQAREQIKLPTEAIRSRESTVDVVNRVTEALRIAQRVRPGKRVKIPVAVAFAKIDAFFDVLGADHPLVRRPESTLAPAYDDVVGESTHEQVRALLHEWGADDIDTHLRFNYVNFRYFAVSALGKEPDYRNNEVDAHGVQPFRVDEPLLWLLSRFGVVPRQKGR